MIGVDTGRGRPVERGTGWRIEPGGELDCWVRFGSALAGWRCKAGWTTGKTTSGMGARS